jgi:hypothetical protein
VPTAPTSTLMKVIELQDQRRLEMQQLQYFLDRPTGLDVDRYKMWAERERERSE